MPRSSSDEIIQGYIEEVKTYIPSLIQGLETLRETPDHSEAIEEIYRLVHTIKGASAMVGIHGLSHIACQMEDTLDDIMTGKIVFTDDAFQIMSRTVDHFQKYCTDFFEKGVNAGELLKETVLSFRRLRGLPSDEDSEALNSLLKIVPEYEGGKKDSETQGAEEFQPPDEDDDALMELLESEPEAKTDIQPEASENRRLDEDDAALMELLESEPELEAVEEPDELTEPQQAEYVASEPIPELLESFYEEAEEHLQDLGRSLNILESQIVEPVAMSPAQKEVIRQIRRSVHTVKGASAVIGLPNISAFAHSAEDLLDWLYEKAQKITPEIVAVLTDSADLLERIIAHPSDPHTSKVQALRNQYSKITGAETAPEPEDIKAPAPECSPGYELFDEPSEAEDPDIAFFHTRTLRVGMERVDELVNLVGELIIASSGFEQKMDTFITAINELELSRDRLREIAREMEVGYEVKALDQFRSAEVSQVAGRRGQGAGRRAQENVPNESQAVFEDFDTLELDRYSKLNLIIRTLNESVIDVSTLNTHLGTLYSYLDGHLTRQRVILSELQDKMMRIRMTPMQTITNKLRRTVREIAARLEKKIRFVIEGADIELDRVIWEKITDPLMHILRNAADHGIEPPELRQAMGKPPIGTVKLNASREGNQVVIRISDDGAGLNYDSIRRSARKTMGDKVDELSKDELASLIFHPGFSTRGKISEVSGRGVGMDVVKENILDLKGTVRVASQKSRGTQFTIRIPLTLAVVRALLFTAGGRMFAVALNEVKEIIRVEPEDISTQIEDRVKIGDEVFPLYYLTRLLNIKEAMIPDQRSGSEDSPAIRAEYPLLLIVETAGNRNALVIGELVGQREIVIKSTGSHLRYVKGISGATIMGDGSVVPILNVQELLHPESIMSESPDSIVAEKPLEIMIVDDSVSIRQVVSRLMENQGWQVLTAKDGIEALDILKINRPSLIVLDIEMPRMNGYEFLSAVKVQPAYQHIPVVMLTSRTSAKHRNKAISLGAKGFIVKPYNDNEFIDMVVKLTSEQ
jgi:chemosensory pili system protein ChpA (sensor histidine kinase/response regulator)